MADARVVLLAPPIPEVAQQVAATAPQGFALISLPNGASDQEKVEALRDADFLMIHPGSISEDVLRSAARLKLIQLLRVVYGCM